MRALVASVALSLLVLAGCGDDAPVATGVDPDPTTTMTTTTTAAPPVDSEQARLDEARRRWQAAGVEDYRLTWTVQCFCPRTAFVDTIIGGDVVSHEQVADSDARNDPGPKTVPDIFDEVQAAIAAEPAALEVTYDEETGAVTSWWADYQLNVADEEQGLEVQLQPLVDGVRTPATASPPASQSSRVDVVAASTAWVDQRIGRSRIPAQSSS